jgi:protocatechuate 3,4-dioxygenase beta subunit
MKKRIELQSFVIVAPRSRLARRTLLKGVGSALLGAPLAPLLGCSSGGSANDTTGVGAGGIGGAGGGLGADAAAGTSGGADAPSGWATGGTAAMTDKATYPNPFAGAAASACALTCEATEGPCYAATSEQIQDISYGYPGLPTRMYLQIFDDGCAPIAGASVDVWHVSAAGKYSGNDAANENVAFCTGGDSDFTSHLYFRGRQTTDATGVVFFDTCYPGWYSGRTVHIHLIVRLGDQSYLTTQLFFDDTLNDDVLNSQALYDSRGGRDTTNKSDSVIAASAVSTYLFQTQKMTDGALLAWKTLVIRSSVASASCTIPAGSAGGGAGGPAAPPAAG